MKRWSVVLVLFAGIVGASSAFASGAAKLAEVEIPNTAEARQKGAETVTGVCLMCHSLKYVKYSDLLALGLSQQQVDAMRGDRGMDERLQSMTPMEVRKESYGKVPPDLSLMAIAREDGPRYVYTLLTSYYVDKDGNTDNHLYPKIKMPDMMGYSMAADPKEKAAIEAQVRDAAAFLVWAADPNAETRKQIGIYVMGYLVLLAVLLYLLKRRVWWRVKRSYAAAARAQA